MPRRCTVCDHPKREEIEEALTAETQEAVAEKFGVARSALQRHKANHMINAALWQWREPGEALEAGGEVAEEVQALRQKVHNILSEGEGYSLKGAEIQAWLLRDPPIEPREHVRYIAQRSSEVVKK